MSRLQEHILPSVEMLMRLWAFWVPTTFTQYTGCCGNTHTGVLILSNQHCPPIRGSKMQRVSMAARGHIAASWAGRPRDRTHRVRGGRQRGPLHGRPFVAAVVPQHDLARVGAPHHQVGVELGEGGGHDGRLFQGDRESVTRRPGGCRRPR